MPETEKTVEENIHGFSPNVGPRMWVQKTSEKTATTKAAALLHRTRCHHWLSSPHKGKSREESCNTTTTQSANSTLREKFTLV